MGYSHYWKKVGMPPTEKKWAQIQERAREIVEKHKDILCFEFNQPDKKPEISSRCVQFNGKGDDGCETFLLLRNMEDWEFCKTERELYDVAVVEMLKAVKELCPKWLSLASDGNVF